MKLFPFYSSSSGNLYCLEHNNTNILIDVGVSYKNIVSALNSINKSFDDISAILITHEHIDHVKGVSMISKKHNIPFYTCEKTKEYLENLLNDKNIPSTIQTICYDKEFKINDLTISAFETSHDAAQPCGFHIKCNDKKLSFATDLGQVSDNIMNYLFNSDYIVLESNYDKTMLDFGPYPFHLKSRIKSSLGHLSNDDTANVIKQVLTNNSNSRFLIGHLSSNNNTYEIAKQTIFDELNNNGYLSYDINFATKDFSFEEYLI